MKWKTLSFAGFAFLIGIAAAHAQRKPAKPLKVSAQDIALDGPVQASVVAVDVDGDQRPEILVSEIGKGIRMIGQKHKWRVSLAVGRATPTAGDLDKDGKIELIVPFLQPPKASETPPQRRSALAVFNAEGKRIATWPIDGEVAGAVVLKDLDGDGRLELLMATIQGQLIALDAKGKPIAGFPKKIDNVLDVSEVTILSSPAVGELDGDRSNGPEIVVATNGGKLYAFHRNGESLPRYPIALDSPALASPIIGDIDGDGRGEILIVSSRGTVELRKPDGMSHKGFPVKLKQPVTASPLVYDFNGDGKREIYIGTMGAFVFALDHKGATIAGWPRKLDASVEASLLAGDVNGDAKPDLLVATRSGRLFAFKPTGLQVSGYPITASGPVYATPVLADVSGNGKANWIVARQDKKLSILEDPRPSVQALRYGTPWASFQGGVHHTGSLDNVRLPSPVMPLAPPPKKQDPPKQVEPPTAKPPQSACGCQQTSHRTPDFFLSLLLLCLCITRIRLRRS